MQHPFFYAYAKRVARNQVMGMGHNRSVVDDALNDISEDTIDTEMQSMGLASLQSPDSSGKFGAGTFIQAIIDFFKSSQGQALIASLIKMILALIGGGAIALVANTTEKS